MQHDARGQPVSTVSPECVDAIDRFVEACLGYTNDVPAIARAVEADPDCALAHAGLAAATLFLESAQGFAEARPMVEAARRLGERATARERSFVELVACWSDGAAGRLARLHRTHAESWPEDLFAAKLGQVHAFYRGDFAGMLELGEAVLPANRDDPRAHGMLAFALEQARRLPAAEAAARHALALEPGEAWAHHALAHVFETEGRIEEGIAFLEAAAPAWDDLNSFIFTHNWWHVALLHLDRDDAPGVLRLYDERVWGRWKDYSQDQLNAVSLLARLEAFGIDVGERWRDVGGYLLARVEETVAPFNDLQFLYRLARAGHAGAARAKLARLRADAEAADPYVRRAWQEVAVPLAEGLLAHGLGDHDRGAGHMGAAIGRHQEIGGSHAQRDLFDILYLDALRRSGATAEAAALIARRLADRPASRLWRRIDLAGTEGS